MTHKDLWAISIAPYRLNDFGLGTLILLRRWLGRDGKDTHLAMLVPGTLLP
jgi:hypothetical protein